MTELNYEEIRRYIEDSTLQSVVMIGCDSVRRDNGKSQSTALYSTVVCIRNATGEGKDLVYRGCKVFGASVVLPDYGSVIKSGKMRNLKMRMLQEVQFALEAFENVYESIGDRPWEIHLDISSRPECESNVALAEARGWVLGLTGKEPEFKPHALAASFAADAHAHGVFQ